MQDPQREAGAEVGEMRTVAAEGHQSRGSPWREPHFARLIRSLTDAGATYTPVAKPLIGQSPATLALVRQIEAVAPSDANVLITGESGTGKGVVAAELHRRSGRGESTLLAIDCATMPEALLPAPSVVVRDLEPGAMACGTLLFDEVGDLSPLWQARLLRYLQQREFAQAAGEDCGIRLVATSSRDLSADMLAGRFRADLLFRLKVVSIAISPLRVHPEDIPALGTYFARSFALATGRPGMALAPDTVALLQSHDWPGNVRELENVIHNAVLVENAGLISPDAVALAAGRGLYSGVAGRRRDRADHRPDDRGGREGHDPGHAAALRRTPGGNRRRARYFGAHAAQQAARLRARRHADHVALPDRGRLRRWQPPAL